MKKLLKWTATIAGTLLAILIIGIVALPLIFPLEKIKEFAVAKISETIHREVKVEKVSFDIFSGIKLKGLYIGNRPGFAKKPFVTADSIELRYAFWPLFSRQILIKELRLVKPEILVEKNVRGEFNFSDLLQSKEKPTNEKRKRDVTDTDKQKTRPPFDLFITAFSIKDGRIIYSDYAAKTTNEIKNLNVRVSGFELALVKPIDIKASASITYQGKEIPVSLSGRVGVSMAQESITVPNLSLSIAGESVTASAAISDWKDAPKVVLSVSSKRINVDPLLAIFAAPAKVEKPRPKPGELTKTINALTASIPRNISVNAKADIENLTFQKFKVDRLLLAASLANKRISADVKEIKIYDGSLSSKLTVDLNVPGLGYEIHNLKLTGFNSAPFTNAIVETFLTSLPDYKDLINKVYGTLDVSASLKGRGAEPQDIFANLAGDASLTLKNGELKRLKTLAEVGKMLNSNTLQGDLKFGVLNADCGIKSKVVAVKSLNLEQTEIKLNFKGGIDLNRLVWVSGNRLTLKLAPSITKDLPKEFSIFRDDTGWVELPFEMTGGLTKPFPRPILEKPLEVATEKIKAKIEAKKVEIIEKGKAELATKEEEAKKALEEEAKKKLKEMIKF
jgi:uncharacterized protein involved in outer membrane biogenesis